MARKRKRQTKKRIVSKNFVKPNMINYSGFRTQRRSGMKSSIAALNKNS